MGITQSHARHVMPAYAGEISPKAAWKLLQEDPAAVLVDVRTPPEWAFSGEANLGSIGKETLRISWKLFPAYTVNEYFTASLKEAGIASDAPLLFLCRTGGRSLDAACAATAQGFTRCYNVTDGFEGAANENRQRGMISGWKASGLPWSQS